MISITTEIRCYLRRDHCWQTLFLLFKFEASKTKECFVSRTNAPLVGTLSIGDVSLSIAISWKTIEGFISFGGWSIFITKVALQIYQLSVYVVVMFSVVQNQAQVVIALDRTSALSGNTQTSTQQRTNTGFCNIKKHPISRLSSPFHYFKRSLFQAPR